MDPTIPRKRARRPGEPPAVLGMSVGWFVERDDGTVVFADRKGNSWPAERVRLVQGFGGEHSGIERAPRPWRFDGDGNPTLRGDLLLLGFLDADPKQPIAVP